MSASNEQHCYTFSCIGLKHHEITKDFMTRGAAKAYMFSLIAKHMLVIKETYTDKHDVTYKCNEGVKFYIQRM